MLGQRLAQIRKRRRLTQQDLAQKMGARYDQSFISKVEAGNRSLRLDGVIHASRALGVSTDYLLGEKRSPGPDSVIPPFVVPDRDLRDLAAGAKALNRLVEALEDRPLVAELTTTGSSALEEGPEVDPDPVPLPAEVVEPPEVAAEPVPEYREIPSVEVHASAGTGEIVNEEPAGLPLHIDRDSLPRWARRHELSCIHAQGDSMTPTIQDGDLLIVATSYTEAVHDQIVVVQTADGLVVKRNRQTEDSWELVSDNSKYPPRPTTEDDRIVGRVAWHGKLPTTLGESPEED